MERRSNHYYYIESSGERFNNMKEVCDRIGIKQPQFKYVLRSGFVKKITNSPDDTGLKLTQHEENRI